MFKDWQDPYPRPIIERYSGVYVVRDDLLGVGSKVRFLDYLIGHAPEYAHVKEWVFGSCPFCGYAQISLPVICNRYGKKAVLFMAERSMNNLHPYQQRGRELGVIYHWVANGMLAVTQKRARDYAAENSDRAVLPIGLEHPTVINSIIKVAHSLDFIPDVFWTVGSSGTLNRGLQAAWPTAEAHVVEVGHSMKPHEIGRARHHKAPYKFSSAVKNPPPFPSAANYDAKGWEYMINYYSMLVGMPGQFQIPEKILFWNVGA